MVHSYKRHAGSEALEKSFALHFALRKASVIGRLSAWGLLGVWLAGLLGILLIPTLNGTFNMKFLLDSG